MTPPRTHGPTAPWRIGVDVGGTFTDLALIDAEGRLSIVKTPSVPTDPARGVIDALGKAAAGYGMSVGALLAGCRLFVHGSTVATNTVLEGKGAKVGLLVTDGFRDSLEIRRGLRENPWDHRTPFAPPMVPRHLRRPVRGRQDPDGREIAPLEPDDVRAACALFRQEGVEAVAICLFNAYADGRHERAAEAIVREAWDGRWISLSSAVAPTIGEYARTSTTVTNAAVAPRVVGYLRALDAELKALGLPGTLLVSQSNGGIVSVDQIAVRPVNLVLSGPAAGVGALRLAAQALGDADLISMEIGGTSCDVALMSAGRVATSDDLEIAGYHLSVPSVEIHTVGAGGGTIAGVDAAGMLFAGPKGAGARPGPACYGFGGCEPTVTDAQLVLGRLAPGAYAGGSVTLDPERAREAIRTRLAEPLGLSVEDAAAGVIRLVEQNLLHAVERISVQRGFDPRGFTLVPAGGAGPLHWRVAAASALGAKRASTCPATGGLLSPGGSLAIRCCARTSRGCSMRLALANTAYARCRWPASPRALETRAARRSLRRVLPGADVGALSPARWILRYAASNGYRARLTCRRGLRTGLPREFRALFCRRVRPGSFGHIPARSARSGSLGPCESSDLRLHRACPRPARGRAIRGRGRRSLSRHARSGSRRAGARPPSTTARRSGRATGSSGRRSSPRGR